MAVAKIVSSAVRDSDGYVSTMGTKVFVDGKELEGISKITLVAGLNDVWKAQIECAVHVEEIDGVKIERVTSLKDDSEKFRRVQ